MLQEKTSIGEVNHSENNRINRRLTDSWIRTRKSVLNRIVGVSPALVFNDDLPVMKIATPSNFAAKLKQNLTELKASVMDETGTIIDYTALQNSPAYDAYRKEWLLALKHFKPGELSSLASRKAFWINLYNTLVMDAIINFGVKGSVIESPMGILTFFHRAAYLVDSQRISLEDIEHGILRANLGHPYLPGAHFTSTDPRLEWSLPLDPRVHFALNCGGRSCPPIRSYSAEELDGQLDVAAQAFVESTVDVDRRKKQIQLSLIFKWYIKDFGGRKGLLGFLIRYLPNDERRQFLIEEREEVKFRYTVYDWGLNSI